MSEQMRRDMEAGRGHNFRATFVKPKVGGIPDGTRGTCWKTADFDKKDSLTTACGSLNPITMRIFTIAARSS
jgi:hypothetical protein